MEIENAQIDELCSLLRTAREMALAEVEREEKMGFKAAPAATRAYIRRIQCALVLLEA